MNTENSSGGEGEAVDRGGGEWVVIDRGGGEGVVVGRGGETTWWWWFCSRFKKDEGISEVRTRKEMEQICEFEFWGDRKGYLKLKFLSQGYFSIYLKN